MYSLLHTKVMTGSGRTRTVIDACQISSKQALAKWEDYSLLPIGNSPLVEEDEIEAGEEIRWITQSWPSLPSTRWTDGEREERGYNRRVKTVREARRNRQSFLTEKGSAQHSHRKWRFLLIFLQLWKLRTITITWDSRIILVCYDRWYILLSFFFKALSAWSFTFGSHSFYYDRIELQSGSDLHACL